MLSKLINAWRDSYRVAESHRAVRLSAERLVWGGSGEARFSGRQLATVGSWL